jgi:hypothetical protein
MKTIKREYKVYSFGELTEEAQEKALETLRNINVDYEDWHEPYIEDFREDMAKLGYIVDKVYYSGFWSQGDGASFTGSVDVREWLKIKKLKSKYRKLLNADLYLKFNITQSGHYCHEMTMRIENAGDDDDTLYELEDLVLDEAREKARHLYKVLDDAYSESCSDAMVIETIEANAYTFLEDGSLFN